MTRKTENIAAIVLFVLLGACLFGAACLLFSAIGIWNISFVAGLGGINMAIDQSHNLLATVFYTLSVVIVLLAGFFGSCGIYKSKFEQK